MNIIVKKHLPRRTFLRGLGGVLALPLLDAMMPALAGTTKAPTRTAILYFPNGIQVPAWNMDVEGDNVPLPATLARTLEPLEKYRNDISVLRGLTVNGGRALGDG